MAIDSKKIAQEVIEETNRRISERYTSRLEAKLDEWLEAHKTVSAVIGKGAGAGTVDFVDVPDYATQVKAGQMIIDIIGLNAPKKLESDQNVTVNLVNYSDMGSPKVEEPAKQIEYGLKVPCVIPDSTPEKARSTGKKKRNHLK